LENGFPLSLPRTRLERGGFVMKKFKVRATVVYEWEEDLDDWGKDDTKSDILEAIRDEPESFLDGMEPHSITIEDVV
jgi:hypothetical protein